MAERLQYRTLHKGEEWGEWYDFKGGITSSGTWKLWPAFHDECHELRIVEEPEVPVWKPGYYRLKNVDGYENNFDANWYNEPPTYLKEYEEVSVKVKKKKGPKN
jgi:hypothetical protein